MSGDEKIENGFNFSPLYRIRKHLKILSFVGGFPLSSRDGNFIEFIFRPVIEWFKLLLVLISLCATIAPSCLVTISVKSNVTEAKEVTRFFHDSGLSSFDVYVSVSFIPINSISMFCLFLSFRNSSIKLSDICQKTHTAKKKLMDLTNEFSAGPHEAETEALDEGWKHILKIYICNILCTVCQTYSGYVILYGCRFGTWLSTPQKILILLSYVAYMVRYGYPLISASSEYIIISILNDINEGFRKWNSIITGYFDSTEAGSSNVDLKNTTNKWFRRLDHLFHKYLITQYFSFNNIDTKVFDQSVI